MANTEKASKQVESIGDKFEISNHSFVNQLIAGLQGRVSQTAPGLKVIPVGKTSSQGKIELTLMGQVTLEDTDSVESATEKTRQLMDSLKNPANLLSLLDK